MPVEDIGLIPEATSAYLTLKFYDKEGDLAAPSTVTYRIDCLTTGVEIKDDTALSPASTIEITLTAADNAIQNQGNVRERRLVTIKAVYGTDDELKGACVYEIENLAKVP